jgi:hypothetical protein
MPATARQTDDPFLSACNGYLSSALKWAALDTLWDAVRARDAHWYIYEVGNPPPTQPASRTELLEFIQVVDALLHEEHQEDYCGIVYADNHQQPDLVKIYHPGNLGVVCGFSDQPTYPGWILSTMPPRDITLPPDTHRSSWWRKLFT